MKKTYISGMEICQLSVRFSAIPFGIGHALAFGKLKKSVAGPTVTAIRSYRTDKWEQESGDRMFILGVGFVGDFFGQELKKEGWVVSGTCTSVAKKNQLEKRGFDVHLFNANEPEQSILNTMKCHTHLVVSIPPVLGIGDPMLQHGELLRHALMDGNLQWLCYLSSTSVYGHCAGALVDEDYPASPTSKLAKLRLAAEEGWLNLGHDLGLSAQVFRLGGIYGPGRSAVDTVAKQEPLSEGQKRRVSRRFTSRVHVDDICQALKAAIYRQSSGRIYNIVDDDPAPREEVFAYATGLIEKKWPGRVQQSTYLERPEPLTQKGSSQDEKRVSNARMKKELGVRLLHPSYKSGLLSIIEQMEEP